MLFSRCKSGLVDYFLKLFSGKIILAKPKGSLIITAGVAAEGEYFFQGACLCLNKSTSN